MVRSVFAASLGVVLATCVALRAQAEEPVNPLRGPQTKAPSRETPWDVELASHDEPLPSIEPVAGEAPPAPALIETPPPVQPGHLHQDYVELPEPTWFESFSRSWSSHHHPGDPQRHFGWGSPLVGTSWRNRPLYVSLFAGGLIGDELQAGVVDQGGGFVGGIRFGGDFDHYWGLETRFAASDLHVNYAGDVDSGQSSNTYFDASMLHYPWGDSRWRPYLTVGFGLAGYQYQDAEDRDIRATAVVVPWGAGLKYLLTRNAAIRFDLIDNFSFKSGEKADTMHNFSFTGGVEFHFGGRRTSYGSW